MKRPLCALLTVLCLVALTPTALAAESCEDGWTKIKARAFGDSTIRAKAVFRERCRTSGTERRFQVEVERAAAGQQFDVFVNDRFVETITANGAGFVEYQLRTAAFIDDPGDGLPMPADFPSIQSGDTVVIGHTSGVFFDLDDSVSDERQEFRLRVDIESGNDQVEATVRYRERFKNGRLLRKFKVKVEDAEAGDEYEIAVNGEFVGVVVIDSDNEGRLELRTPAFIDDPGDGDPMPSSFPTLLDGDVVTVGPLTGVLQRRA